MQTLRQLVAGTDFSRDADQAVELAIQLASSVAAGVTLVHVCELGVDGSDDQRLRQCAEVLSQAVARHRRRGVEITGVLRSGNKPWEKLDNVATELGASLIVVGRHGAGRGRSAELGSVADHLVRSASRSVLTVARNFDDVTPEAHQDHHSHGKNETP